jgi:hypothetical protein
MAEATGKVTVKAKAKATIEAMAAATAKLMAEVTAKATCKVMADSTAEATAKGMAEAKIDQQFGVRYLALLLQHTSGFRGAIPLIYLNWFPHMWD